MDTTGYGAMPPILCHWITFLAKALPVRAVPTFIELLMGAMLSRRGWVTEAWLAIAAQRHWSSYYKWLQRGRWSGVRLGQYLGGLLRCSFRRRLWYWVIDDTVICRASKRAPGSRFHHNHAHPVNRPAYLHGQCWVSLAVVLSRGRQICAAIPLLSRLQRATGQGSKLTSAQVLIRALGAVFQDLHVRVLLDSGYMRRGVIEYGLAWGFQVIGQVRRDTALYALPESLPAQRRGRRRVYGAKYTAAQVAALPEYRVRLGLYGQRRWVRYRSAQAKARFLKGRVVRAVWIQFEDEQGHLITPRWVLATEADLRPTVIIVAYARRWAVESMFCQVKHAWGWAQAWQQSRQVLARWVQILSVAYALPALLALRADEHVAALVKLTPWRANQPLTAGRVRLGLQRLFTPVNVRAWWDPKWRKFHPPAAADGTASEPPRAKAA